MTSQLRRPSLAAAIRLARQCCARETHMESCALPVADARHGQSPNRRYAGAPQCGRPCLHASDLGANLSAPDRSGSSPSNSTVVVQRRRESRGVSADARSESEHDPKSSNAKPSSYSYCHGHTSGNAFPGTDIPTGPGADIPTGRESGNSHAAWRPARLASNFR